MGLPLFISSVKLTIRVRQDTSWDLRLKDGPIIAKNEQTFVNNRVQLEERDVCVDDSSLYEFTVYDEYGDGMDTRYGKGHYKIFTHHSVDVEADASEGEAILHGGYFIAKNITHLINTTIPAMTERDVKWLTSHNKRRRYWHEHYNTTFIPLQWSESLKAEAQVWANALLDSCYTGAYHDPSRIYGESILLDRRGPTYTKTALTNLSRLMLQLPCFTFRRECCSQ